MTETAIARGEYSKQGGAKLHIMNPSMAVFNFNYMATPGAIKVDLASFGRFQTGTSIQGSLKYPPIGSDACGEMLLEDHTLENYNHGFVLVDDGNCTWEEKARNVQNLGAHALIIAEDWAADEIVGRADYGMLDTKYDGSGTSVHIPTLLIDVDDAEALKLLLKDKPNFDSEVMLKADIEISNKDAQTISYSLFYGSILDLEPTLLLDLYEYQHGLQKKATFIPRIMTFECQVCPEEIKQQHCISDGFFCFTPPNEDKAKMYPKLTDRQLITENLRERCMYEEIGEMEDEFDDHLFFNYLYNMHFTCLNNDRELTDHCANRQMKNLGLPVDKIEKCIQNSFDDEGDWTTYNELLWEDREDAQQMGIQLNPSLTINSNIYDGPMKGEPIFRKICSAYHYDTMPEMCKPDFDIQLVLGHIDDFQPPKYGHWHLILAILLVLAINAGLIIWCIKRKRRENDEAIHQQVQMQVESYFKLKSDDNPSF